MRRLFLLGLVVLVTACAPATAAPPSTVVDQTYGDGSAVHVYQNGIYEYVMPNGVHCYKGGYGVSCVR